jgi:hypothetical protein
MRAPLLSCILLASAPVRARAEDPRMHAAPARAQPVQAEPPLAGPVRSSFWRGITQPELAQADRLVASGRALLDPALGLGLAFGERTLQRKLAIESAITRLSAAVALAPDHREARLYLAKALAFWEDRSAEGALVTRTREAIEQLETLRKLDPEYAAEEVAFQLGVLSTRAHDFARAVTEYRRALSLRSGDDQDSTLLDNLAEVTMLSGDLAGALALYERADRSGAASGRVLSLWGAAVVLDRLGDHRAAIDRAKRALDEDRVAFASLHQGGVFFVPEYEVFYYEGLGNLALADKEREDGEALATLLRRGEPQLDKAVGPASLRLFMDTLGSLPAALAREPQARSGQATPPPWLRALTARVARAQASQRAPAAAPEAEPTRPVSEPLPTAREPRALLYVLRALAAFALYLQHDGGGPFAEDARVHVDELAQLLARGHPR